MCICCMSEVLTNELIPSSKAWPGAGSGRWYSDTTTVSRLYVIKVETRVLKVCSAYDKVIADKLCKSFFIIFSDGYAALQYQTTDDY